MRHHRHGLLRKKGNRGLIRRLLSPFFIVAAFLCLVSSVGAEKPEELETLNTKYRCVSGKLDDIGGQGGGAGQQDVTVADGQTLEGTPKATFPAMVRNTVNRLDYELIADYRKEMKDKCGEAIKGLVKDAGGCQLVGEWHEGFCDEEGKCMGGGLRVACRLSEVKQVQDDSGPTGYSLTDVTVWSSAECLSVSAKFTKTDKNFCYLVPQSEVTDKRQAKTVKDFVGRTITTRTTEATTEGTTAAKTTTEKTTSTETNSATEVVSTTTTGENNTAVTTTTEDDTTETQGTTAGTTNTDERATGPTTKDPAGFRLAWYYWMIASVVVVVLVGLGASAYFWHRRHRLPRPRSMKESSSLTVPRSLKRPRRRSRPLMVPRSPRSPWRRRRRSPRRKGLSRTTATSRWAPRCWKLPGSGSPRLRLPPCLKCQPRRRRPTMDMRNLIT